MNAKFIEIANSHKTEFEFFKKTIFPVVMQWEGGGKLHNILGDSGGQTIWGIAYNKNKQHFDSLQDHANTTETEAAAFAFCEYYLPLSPTLLPRNTKLYAFDMAYNMGVGKAKQFIQEVIGVKADGVFGSVTKQKLNTLSLSDLHTKRKRFYEILSAKSNNSKFLKGWLNRANDIYIKSSKL